MTPDVMWCFIQGVAKVYSYRLLAFSQQWLNTLYGNFLDLLMHLNILNWLKFINTAAYLLIICTVMQCNYIMQMT